MKSGAEIFVEGLIRHGVDTLFGIPGVPLLPILDALSQHRQQIHFILTRHEQGAGHMADGYARATGKVGVCLATSGPGAANLTTALATAYKDSIPIVAFTGQVATSLIGHNAFQEIDTVAITRPITKANFIVKNVKELALIMQQAFYIATVGRPGPVLVDIPADIQRSYCELVWRNKISHSNFKVRTVPHPAKITKAATLINNAVKPLLYIGGGAIHAKARDAILELAEKAKIPIVSTLMGLGVIPNNHPNYLEMPGVHGNYAANMAFQHCDLIIAVGARFDNRVTANIEGFARHAKVIHIDIDPAVINQNVHVDLPVVGDANIAVTNINKQIKSVASRVWLKQVQMWKKTHPLKYKNSHKLHPQSIVSKVSELTQHEAIVVTDVGQHQMWAAQFYQFNYPRQWLSSGGCGTMGFGLPAAIGAKLAHPHKTVILITSEGSFQMTMQELAVVAINKLDIKIFILNNNYYGMIRQAQQIYFNHNYFAVDLSTSDGAATSRSQKKKNELDFALIAEAYNIKTLTIDSVTTADKVLRQAFKLTGPVLVNIMIEREENVLPLIEPNKSLDDIILTLL